MGDLIKLYERKKPLIEMLLKDESKSEIEKLKALAYEYFSEGNMNVIEDIIWEYGQKFPGSWLTVEKGNILMIYRNVPYFICKTRQRIEKESNIYE